MTLRLLTADPEEPAMTMTRTPKLLALVAIFVLGACSASETATAVADTTTTESQPAPTAPEIATQPVSDDSADTSTDASAAPVDAAPGPGRGMVTFGDEEFVFDMWQCGGFGDEAFYASGLLLSDPNSDIELGVSYELPMVGDGDNAEYDNTVRLIFGNDTWKAGTLSTSAAEEVWGTLDWSRDDDNLTGTATMEHSWGQGSESSQPRLASFQISC